MIKHLTISTVVALLFLGFHACGQPAPAPPGPGMEHPPPPPGAMGGPPMGGPERMGPGPRGLGPMPPGRGGAAEEDLRSLLRSVMMARVSRSLDLSEEQTVLLVRRFSEHQDAMMGLRKQRHGLSRALGEAIEKGADDEIINQKLDALIALDEQAATASRRLLDTMSKGLSAAQRAKLYNILREFESDLRALVMRARQRHGFKNRPEGGGRAGAMRGKGGEGRGRDFVTPPRDIQESRGFGPGGG